MDVSTEAMDVWTMEVDMRANQMDLGTDVRKKETDMSTIEE